MKHIPLDDVTLRKGAHDNRKDGVCLLEAVAWFAGEEHSDGPECACPVLIGMGQQLNDLLPDHKRIRLLPMVPRIVGTKGDGMAERRGLMAADWLVRTYTPTWLRLAKLDAEADALEALPEIMDTTTMEGAMGALNQACKSPAAARAAARAAAGAATWAAARAAARDATWAAARAAARAAAGAATWAATWAAARAAAGAATWAAAGAATWAAAGDAAWAAAGAAAWDALNPTVDVLQDSAIELYARMVNLRPAGVEVVVPERVLLPLTPHEQRAVEV